MNWVLTLSLFSLILCLSATGQESVDLLKFHDPAETHEDSSWKALAFAVQLKNEHLKNVSASLLMAETWVRAHVLAYYPANNVTAVLVGETILCKNGNEENNLDLILPSVKNIYYSLTRWGLQNDIKVAASFASHCVDYSKSEAYVAESHIKPLLKTLQDIGSPYVLNLPQNLHSKSLSLLKSHLLSMGLENMNFMVMDSSRKQKTFTGRKLSYVDFGSSIDPFPPRPAPISPTHAPAFASNSPLPPLIGTISPISSPSFLPHLAPMVEPATPPFGPHLPPCTPSEGGGAGAPARTVHNGVWCVAKPSVPSETLQEALDYACGEGSADCDAIRPHGSCYFPDTLVAHASYAFNSYWQKTKGNGGSCGFGGTAMLINSDPSYRHCRFILY